MQPCGVLSRWALVASLFLFSVTYYTDAIRLDPIEDALYDEMLQKLERGARPQISASRRPFERSIYNYLTRAERGEIHVGVFRDGVGGVERQALVSYHIKDFIVNFTIKSLIICSIFHQSRSE